MSNASATKTVVGRQSQLPFKRALTISLNSLKIRFWRSIVTAGGIFLGMAFFTVVQTQALMQWPLPEKVDSGFVRVGGQVDGPGDIEVWSPVSVKEGLAAGIPADVIDRVSRGKDTFQLAEIVQGQIQAKRADKNLARVNKEWEAFAKIKDALAFFSSAAVDADMTVKDAVKYGVPRSVANKLAKDSARLAKEAAKEAAKVAARAPVAAAPVAATPAPAAAPAPAAPPVPKGPTFKGSLLAEVVRESPEWLSPLYSCAVLDQDISINDAVKGGVPEAIARHLAGEGKTFKAAPLNDAIKIHPTWQAIWRARVKRNAIFKSVDKTPLAALGKAHALTLNDVLKEAKLDVAEALRLGKSDKVKADMRNIMVVNVERRVRADFERNGIKAGNLKLVDGDTIMVADRNSRYRSAWLVIMSLLVCTVGITNSMLMAVTERFKEIGTMKCLGALDGFVVLLFMLESGMMGVVASALGWALGFVSIVLVAGFTKGWGMVANMEPLSVLYTFLAALGVGLFLTICATIAPAKRAADMPAAMALRSEI